jgi:hypothetical protein
VLCLSEQDAAGSTSMLTVDGLAEFTLQGYVVAMHDQMNNVNLPCMCQQSLGRTHKANIRHGLTIVTEVDTRPHTYIGNDWPPNASHACPLLTPLIVGHLVLCAGT